MASVISRGVLGLSFGIAFRSMPGETVCGDLAVVARRDNGYLLAAIDGVGHGEQAFIAARAAADVLERYASEPVGALVERCHVALRGTRGAAMGVAAIHSGRRRLTWLGVGNVQGLLQHSMAGPERGRDVLLQRAGLVGVRLPRLYASSVALREGDVLALATDGLRAGFGNGLVGSGAPQDVADRTLESLGQSTDDALVIVGRLSERPA